MNKIEWTEKSWNVITGCTKVSAGCKNCYAATIAKRFWGNRKFSDVRYHKHKLDYPLKRKKPTVFFVNSMSDLYHEKVSNEQILEVLDVIDKARQHTFQILTKRASRMVQVMNLYNKNLPNLWLGVSVENKEEYINRVPHLCKIDNVGVRWISFEPLLDEVFLDVNQIQSDKIEGRPTIDWVVVGGESGAKKRIFNPDWARRLRDDCRLLGIPFFMKQIDKVKPIPEDLMIRQYPFNLKKD